MRLKIAEKDEGLHPSELVVKVKTREGLEEVVIHPKSLKQDTLAIGSPVDRNDGYSLVELPRQTASGIWRVWVQDHFLTDDEGYATA